MVSGVKCPVLSNCVQKYNLSLHFGMKTDIRLSRTGAWMDGTGRNGSIGGRHGLWLWKLVRDPKHAFLSLISQLRK